MNISAVIPTYNNAAYLAAAINSVLRQTSPVDEIIVVDDGSTDETAAVAKSFGSQIQYIKQDNAGPSAARNTGIKHAAGDWVAFLDADDQWTETKIEEQKRNLQQQPELALIASDMTEVSASGATLVASALARHGFLRRFKELDGSPLPNALASLLQANFVPTGTVLANRQVLIEAGMFNTAIRYGEDLELWCRIASQHAITCLPKVHLLRRQHGGNVTQASMPMLKDLTLVMETVRDWGHRSIRAQGMDPDLLVAKAWTDLGYWYFDCGDFSSAKNAMTKSLENRLTGRAIFYYFCSMLPSGAVSQLRQWKQKVNG